MTQTPFKIYRFLLTLRVQSKTEFSNFPGIAIRGGMGHMLKKIVCVMADTGIVCLSCPLKESCPYMEIFETPLPTGSEMMKKATNCPHPFALTPLFSAPAVFESGDQMKIVLSLFGEALNKLPTIIASFHLLGDCGLGTARGRFCIEKITNVTDNSELMFDGRNVSVDNIKPISVETHTNVERLKITFLTPCHIVHNRKTLPKAELNLITKSVLRRLSLLAYFFGNERNADVLSIPLPNDIQKESEHISLVRTSRYSNRQKRMMPLEGFVGEAEWTGKLDHYYSILKYGEAINIGKNTSFGFGAIRVEGISRGVIDA